MTTTTSTTDDPFSPRSSVGSSTDSSCLPHRRIRCSKTRIAVGERQFESASDALLAYLGQFDQEGNANGISGGGDGPLTNGQSNNGYTSGKLVDALFTDLAGQKSSAASRHHNGLVNGAASKSSTSPSVDAFNKPNGDLASEVATSSAGGGGSEAVGSGKLVGRGLAGSGLVLANHGIAVAGTREDVEDLLTSKVSPKHQEEVTDTLREVKLRRLLKQAALKSKNQTKTGLQQEVEAALIRSAELLEKVNREDIQSNKAAPEDASTAGSSNNSSALNTELEALLLGDTSLLEDAVVAAGERGEEGESEPVTPRDATSSLPSTLGRTTGHTYSYHTTRPSRSRHRQCDDDDDDNNNKNINNNSNNSDSVNSLLTSSTTSRGLSQSLSQSQRCAPVSYPGRSRLSRRHRASSIDSLLPPATATATAGAPSPAASLNSTLQLLLNPKEYSDKREALCSPTSSDSLPSNQSDPTDLLHRIRSRSVPPGGAASSGSSSRGRGRVRRSPRAADSSSLALPESLSVAPDWIHQLDESVRKSVPSWIGEMNMSEVSDSVWLHEALLEDESNRRPPLATATAAATGVSKVPSWIGHALESDVNDEEDSLLLTDTSRPALVPLMSTPIRPMGDGGRDDKGRISDTLDANLDTRFGGCASNNVTSLTNDSRPGLNFSDLNTSSPPEDKRAPNYNISNSSSKHVTFTDSLTEHYDDHIEKPPSPKPPSLSSVLRKTNHSNSPSSHFPLSNSNNVNSSNNQNNNNYTSPRKHDLTSHKPSRVLDSEYNGEAVLRNSILPQTARLKKSMDMFAASSENLRRRSVSSSASSEASGGSGASTGNRCSSLDTLALLAGRPLTRSQRHQQLPGPGVISDGTGRVLDQESSSDGMDGDRPWERMVNTIKAPVPVGTEAGGNDASNGHVSQQQLENTLSGGRQPGSMEALKNMLFKLQAEETSTQDDSDKRGEEAHNSSLQNVSQSSMAIIPALENYDFRQEPGGHSLEKALVHLNRLKKLVKTTPTSASSTAAEGEVKDTASNGVSPDIS